jgi:hypothetical protein
MKSVLAEESVYVDPDYASLHGHAELSEAIGRAQEQFGDLRPAPSVEPNCECCEIPG